MSLWGRTKGTVAMMAPGGLALFIVLITIIPLRVQTFYVFPPLVDVILIYYWTIHRPQTMPNWFIFALGLFMDFYYGMPPGVTPLANLLLRGVLLARRRLMQGEPFIMTWAMFFLFSLGVAFCKWMAYSMIMFNPSEAALAPVDTSIVQWLLSVAFYPLLHWLSDKVERTIPDRPSHA